MTKNELTMEIAKDLLDNDTLNESDFSDTSTLLNFVQEVILKHLQDYSLLFGTIL